MTNSRQKGKRGELEWVHFCRDHGYNARRGQQFSGGADSPDIVCEDLPGIHFEVKLVDRLNLKDAMKQAIEDAGDKIPVVAHRRNRGKWMVTMLGDDWFQLINETNQPRIM